MRFSHIAFLAVTSLCTAVVAACSGNTATPDATWHPWSPGLTAPGVPAGTWYVHAVTYRTGEEVDWRRVPAADRLPGRKTWSPRQTLLFVVVSCGLFWGVVVSAMVMLHRFMVTVGDLVRWFIQLNCKAGLHIFQQSGLIVLHRQHVMAIAFSNLLGDLLLTAHRIDGHQRPVQVEQFESRAGAERGDAGVRGPGAPQFDIATNQQFTVQPLIVASPFVRLTTAPIGSRMLFFP